MPPALDPPAGWGSDRALPLVRDAGEIDAPRTDPLNFHSLDSYPRVLSAYFAPSLSRIEERLFVFAFLIARRPQRVLEIGFRYGGMSYVMLSAMQDAGRGQLVSVDPYPQPALDFSAFGDRFTLIRGSSPGALSQASAALGGPAEFCFVDGDHAEAAVIADLEGVLPLMAADSYILLHDAYWPEVRRASEVFLARHTALVVDCGFPCPWGNEEGWSGLRLLRVCAPA